MLHPTIQIALYIFLFPLPFIFFRATGFRFNQVSIPTIFFIAFLFQTLIAFPFFFTGFYLYDTLRDQLKLYQMFTNTLVGLVCIFLGIAFANFKKKVASPVIERQLYSYQYGVAVLLFILSGVVMGLYFKTLTEVPFFALMRGATGAELDLLRSDSASSYAGGQKVYYYLMFIHGLLPFLSQYFLAVHLLTKKRFTFFIWFLSFLASCLALLSTLHKAPIIYYFLFNLILWTWVRQKKINWKFGFLALASAFGLVLLFFASIRSYDLTEALPHMLNRAILGQVRDSYYYLEMFPEKVPYLLGQSLGIPSIISPFERHYSLSTEVMNYIYPGMYTEVVGRANTVYWGEIHANFGFFAIPFFSFFIGVYMGVIQRLLEKKVNALNAALLLFFIQFFIILVSSGVSRIFPLNSRFLLVILASILLYGLRFFKPFKIPDRITP